jgi:beta-lactamase regulating signal transducer with metallopeptidase domain
MTGAGLTSILVDASWQLAIGACAIWLLARRLQPNARAWIWRLLALKVCLTPFVSIPLPWLSSAGAEAASVGSQVLAGSELVSAGASAQSALRSIYTSPEQVPFDGAWIIPAIWALGFVIALAVLLCRLVRGERAAQSLLAVGSCERIGGVRVVHARTDCAPTILGLLRPVILLPTDAASSVPLVHELAHAERRDLPWVSALELFRSLFWFHPLAWLAQHEHRLACEEACDALAISRTGISPSAYADALITFAHRPIVAAAALGSSATTLKRRIYQMHRPSIHRLLAATLTVAAASVLLPTRLVHAQAPSGTIDLSLQARSALMLSRADIKREIGLTADQDEKILQVWNARQAEMRAIGNRMAEMKRNGVPAAERLDFENRAKDQFYERVGRQTVALLTATQKERLEQVILQIKGPIALADAAVAKRAGIAATTRDKLAKMAAEFEIQLTRMRRSQGHLMMEAYRRGGALTGTERAKFQRIAAKNKRLWETPAYKRYAATFELAENDPKRLAAGQAFNKFVAANPSVRLTPAEGEEYRRLMLKAIDLNASMAERKRFAREEQALRDRTNARVMGVLNLTERSAWTRLIGKPFKASAS